MLTDAKARTAKAGDKDYKLTDSGGLHLYVTRTGHRSWRLKYRFAGKEKRLVFGSYPELSLKEARDRRDEAKRLLRDHCDPGIQAKRQKIAAVVRHENTFEKFAREWHALNVERWKPVHASDVITSLERDVLPTLGTFPITEIDEVLVLATLKAVERRGAVETAHRLLQRMSSIFKYAKGAGGGNGNPAADVKGSLKAVPSKKRRPAILSFDGLHKLIAVVDCAGASPVTKLASRFMGLTAQRPGMIRTAPWSEIEGIDWRDAGASSPDALWRIPASRMKHVLDLREDAAFEHVVPLSRQAIETLRAVYRMTGRGPLVFPGARSVHEPMSENAVGYLYNRLGFKGVHVPHGWRSSFSTLMNARVERAQPGSDRLIIERLIIDLMLAHVPTGLSETERKYNRAAYMERRRELAQEWADLLMKDEKPANNLLNGPRRPRPD